MPPSMYEGLLVSMPQAPGDHNYKTVPTVVTTQPSAGAAAQVEAACFTEVDDTAVAHQSSCEYDGKDMTAIIELLNFLEGRLNSVSMLNTPRPHQVSCEELLMFRLSWQL